VAVKSGFEALRVLLLGDEGFNFFDGSFIKVQLESKFLGEEWHFQWYE
jgi:hypothetical protein